MELVAYIRCSTKQQDKSYTLQEQEKSIRLYCDLYKHDLFDIKSDTATGGKVNKGLEQLLDIVYSNENVHGIIVDKLDRLFRNTEELLKTIRLLKEKNKVFISVKEQIDISNPSGELLLTVLGAIATFEKSRIKERVLNGKQAKKEVGGYVAGNVPLGYKSTSVNLSGGKMIKKLVQDEQEQELIKIIKNHRRSGKGWTQIATWLNSNGYRTKKNKAFTATQIYNVFNFKPVLLNNL